MFRIIIIFLFIIYEPVIASKTLPKPNPYLIDFQSDVAKMMEFYSPDIKLWQDKNCIKSGACLGHEQGLWFWAQAAMILANYQEQTSDKKYAVQLKDAYTANWENISTAKYYDDRLWWALALIKIYQVNGDNDALSKARLLVDSVIAVGGQSICRGSGGIYWDAAHTQVGSIANTLLITAAGRLYLLTHEASYKKAADKTWQWLQQSGLLNPDYTLSDNYLVTKGKCGALVNWHFTYNNGMLLTAVDTLFHIYHQNKFSVLAHKIADKAVYDYSKGGIIEENCTNSIACADDKFMFKGIFVYNLAEFVRHGGNSMLKEKVRKRLAYNYAAVLNNQESAQIYGFNWGLPVNFERDDSLYNPADIVSYLSVIYLELANVMLN